MAKSLRPSTPLTRLRVRRARRKAQVKASAAGNFLEEAEPHVKKD